MSRPGLIDRWGKDMCPNMFEVREYLPKHARVSILSLFIVTVHSLKPQFAWVIAINSK